MSKVTRLHPESPVRTSPESSIPKADRDLPAAGAAQGDIPSFLRSITASSGSDADHDPPDALEDAPDVPSDPAPVDVATIPEVPSDAASAEVTNAPDVAFEASAAPVPEHEPAQDSAPAGNEPPPESVDPAAREMAQFAGDLRAFDAGGLISTDARTLRNAQARWQELIQRAVRLSSITDGVPELASKHLPTRLASDIRSAVATAGAVRDRSRNQMVENMLGGGADVRAGQGGGGEGSAIAGAIDAMVRSPLTLLSAGGAMIKAGFQAAGNAIDRRRQTAFDVLGGQVKSVAADIEADAQWLRAHGLEQVVNEMKASGIAPSDAASELQRGGKLERLGLEVKGLMAEPDVIERMERLSTNMHQFATKAERYAKAGVAADRECNELLEPTMERVESALDGLPVVDEEGNFSMLSKKFEELAEKVRELVERMVNKLIPGR